MKIAILSVGTRGDVQPYIALGKALKARGHDVVLAAPENFSAWVEGHGLAFHSIGVDMQAFMQSPEVRKVMSGNIFAIMKMWRHTIVPLTRMTLEAMWKAARDADVMVYHPKAAGAVDIAEATGAVAIYASPVPLFPTGAFPFITVSANLGPWFNRLSYRFLLLSRVLLLPTLNRWRRDMLGLGKGPVFLPLGGKSGGAKGDLSPRLCAVSPAVIPRPADWDAGLHMTGYWFLDEGQDWRPDAALAAFLNRGSAPVYIGFGSMSPRDPVRLARTIVEGVRQAGVRAILATGWGGLEQIDVPDTVHVIEAAPHDALFRHVCAVVHHGGAGTTAAGLRAGLPTLICPLSVDQPFWGRRVRSLGCGPKPQPLRRLRADRFARGLNDLTHTESYRARAGEIARAIAKEDGIAAAVTVIEAAQC